MEISELVWEKELLQGIFNLPVDPPNKREYCHQCT